MGELPPLTDESNHEKPTPENESVSPDSNLSSPSPLSPIFQILFNSFILTNLIDGLIHVFLPSTAIQFLPLYPEALYRRSHGILSLSLAILCFGIRQTLRGKASLSAVFMLSLTLYCLASLSNLILSIVFDRGSALHGYLWANLVLHTFWVAGLVWYQRKGSDIQFPVAA